MALPEKPPPCIHNTPALKLALRDELYDIVYERTHERFTAILQDIRDKNRINMGYDWDGFTHRGVYYGQPLEKLPHPNTRFQTSDGKLLTAVECAQHRARLRQKQMHQRNQKLDAGLVPAMDLLLADRDEAEKVEGTMVRSMLGAILNTSRAVGDYRRLLPSLLHPRLDEEEAKCSCQVPNLSDAEIDALKAKHGRYIGLISRRQMIYLLVP